MAEANTNKGLYIRHVATDLAVNLEIDNKQFYFTEFSDVIQTKYNETTTYGRMDPLVNYQGSTRKIQIGLQINTLSYDQEYNNKAETVHRLITRLQKMQYPVYEKGENALTIRSPPIVAVKMFNLIRDGDGAELLCAMDGFSFTPKAGANLSSSPYLRFGEKQVATPDDAVDGSMAFKQYNFKFSFTVLHRRPVGFVPGETIYITDPEDDIGLYGVGSFRFLNGYKFGPREMAKVYGPTKDEKGTQLAQGALFNPADPTNPLQEAKIDSIFD